MYENSIMTIGGVECYEKDGTAYLKLETVARGLGFVDNHDGKDYVRWARVDRFLADLGFATCGERPEYIPENVFYRLAMKAKNEAAEKFQALVADEIIPSIRKTGSYSMQKPMTQLEIIAANAQALVDHERRVQALETSHRQMEAKLSAVAETVIAPSYAVDLWQTETRKTVNRIVDENKLCYQSYWRELYAKLEAVAGVDLDTRKLNMQKRMAKAGAGKLEINNVSKLNVIARDKKLRPIFDHILCTEKQKYILKGA